MYILLLLFFLQLGFVSAMVHPRHLIPGRSQRAGLV